MWNKTQPLCEYALKLWDVASGEARTLRGHLEWVNAVAFSPDGTTLASASSDKTVKIWNVAEGRLLKTLTGHGDWVVGVAFSPDGQLLASASRDGTVKVWDALTGEELATLPHDDGVLAVAFDPSGRLLATGSKTPSRGCGGEPNLETWPEDSSLSQTVRAHKKRVAGFRYTLLTPDKSSIVPSPPRSTPATPSAASSGFRSYARRQRPVWRWQGPPRPP